MREHSSTKRASLTILLHGGIGNQLFQYSFGRALALRNNFQLNIDAESLFARDKRYKRTFSLDIFSIPKEVHALHSSSQFRRCYLSILRGCGRGRSRPLGNRRYIAEAKHGSFERCFLEPISPKSRVVKGYWQCPKYFSDFESAIREDLQFNQVMDQSGSSILGEIKRTSSIGVHVRRTDYNRVLERSYYEEAMNRIRKKIAVPHFFIFSDAPAWWRSQFGETADTTIVSSPNLGSNVEFQLLSSCKHFIIANSTYSWWAAWLGGAKDKTIISPSKLIWAGSSDILPEDWETVNVKEMEQTPKTLDCGGRKFEAAY